jgi:hypothetical protein
MIQLESQVDKCFMLPKRSPCFILLGRFGDLIQMMPAFREVHRRSGKKPVVMVASDYASVFEGVSYVIPHVMGVHWWKGIPAARKLAEAEYGGGTVVQWWNDSPDRIQLLEEATKGGLVLQSHGHEWGVDPSKWPDYGTSMWDRAGFTRQEMLELPLIFDRRNHEHEEVIARQFIHKKKPTVLYNFNGISSPFTHASEVLNVVRATGNIHLVNIGTLKLNRIYDLIGLMDRAAGLITIDTSTLHLALASKVEYLAFVRSDWCRSVPKGNCTLKVEYENTRRRLQAIREWVERISKKVTPKD